MPHVRDFLASFDILEVVMGRRGPIADPNSERSKTGRNTRTRKNPKAVAAEPGQVSMPATISGDPKAAGYWDAHAPLLIAAGRLRPELAATFAILCQLHADCVTLADQVAAEGFVTATDRGQAASPVAKLLRDSRRDYVTLAREFGLTAAADARLPQEVTDGQEESEEQKLLKALSVKRA